MSSTDFYRAFEERHRGPRKLIRSRLQVYQPFITPLLGIYQPANAIDLGCGRGEWLELLQDTGFAPQGVDLDAGMLAACTERGLPVTQGDALSHLQSLDDASQCIVSGFHIAEHLTFDHLKALVQQAFRVLKAGGLLILETPNPENLVVGASNFYLDPTHLRPLPPPLLSFLPEYHGFARVRTLRLQEQPELRQRSDITLMDVLGGVSPDYAVVAQKAAAPDVMERFDTVFDTHYGIDLNDLAGRYDGTLQRRMVALDQRLAKAEAQAVGMTDALARITTLQDAERNALRQSASWRITAPLRWAGSLVLRPATTARTSANWFIHRSIHTFQRPLSRLMAAVLRRPQLSYRINQVLLRYPALYQQLLDVARSRGVVADMSAASVHAPRIREDITTLELVHLTPRARQIYADLQQAIKNAKGID